AAFAAAPFVHAQNPTPSPSPAAAASPAKKHAKKSATAVSPTPALSPAASATPKTTKNTAPTPQATQAPGGGNGLVWVNPSFPTRGVDDPRSRSRTTSWSKGLPHKRDVLGLAQRLSARADAGRRLGRQSELELFEQKLVVGLGVSVAA